ncbi:type II toxin-antitoxin system Phd/YefM family antitoxin [Pseudomonas sp. MWU13-2105]|uniref:type II toxin-antitoxin system Phd/YefM family antitoxin n=1 Tax=Pseudomonas sp. MWU13-2105 TaxID=2935074 RepID=UPI00200DAFCA|nr:plasmid stabilization protein [Pseudomonas sp. MWU13-2105]
MTHILLSQTVLSISNLKKKPVDSVTADGDFSVTNLNRNGPALYCVPDSEYEAMMERLEDMELAAICHERGGAPTIKISLDAL